MNYPIRLLYKEKDQLISIFKQYRKQIEVGELLGEDDEYLAYITEQQQLIQNQIFQVQQAIITLEGEMGNGKSNADESIMGVVKRVSW